MVQPLFDNKKGFITLISILAVGAITSIIAFSIITLGLGSSLNSFALEQSTHAKAFANACAEEALVQIRESMPFSGSNNLNFENGSCNYTVINLSGENREITTSGNVDTTIRKVKINIDKINPQINVVSWQEVADF